MVEVPSLAQNIAQELSKAPFFCLWMEGDMGAGKTTLAGFILRSLGLGAEIPVRSPTFTYLSDYTIGSKTYAHIDLYRLGDDSLVMSDLVHELDYDGLLVEWPQNLTGRLEIVPTHILKIEKSIDLQTRSYQLLKINS